jgi:hypothetical protein
MHAARFPVQLASIAPIVSTCASFPETEAGLSVCRLGTLRGPCRLCVQLWSVLLLDLRSRCTRCHSVAVATCHSDCDPPWVDCQCCSCSPGLTATLAFSSVFSAVRLQLMGRSLSLLCSTRSTTRRGEVSFCSGLILRLGVFRDTWAIRQVRGLPERFLVLRAHHWHLKLCSQHVWCPHSSHIVVSIPGQLSPFRLWPFGSSVCRRLLVARLCSWVLDTRSSQHF